MPGVNRSNVAVTDTFDTWRIRTNELNTSLNLGTNAITGNTVVWRDDDGSFTANVTTINTIAVTHNTTTTALTVTSALEAANDGSKASIVTTGGVLAALKSRFQNEVFIEGKLTTNSHAEFGDSAADTVEFNSTLVGSIVPTANVASNLGSKDGSGDPDKIFNELWVEQGFFRANTTFTGSVIDMVSTSTLGANGVNIVADSEDTGFGINISMDALTTGGLFKVESDSADDSTRTLGTIINQHNSAPGTTVLALQADSGRGLFIDTNLAAGGYSLQIDAEQTTTNTAIIDSAATDGTMLQLTASGVLAGKGVDLTADLATTGTGLFMTMDALTTGKMMDLTSTSQSTGTRSLVKITNDAVEATGTTAFEIDSDAGRGIYVNSGLAASLPSLEITSALATTNTAIITADATTDGTVLQISADLLEDGSALDISSTSTNSATRKLVQITNDADAAVGTTALSIQSDAGRGVYINSTLAAGGPALDIDSTLATTNTVQIIADSTSTGTGIELSVDGLTSGKGLSITSTGTHSGQLVSLVSDGAATGPTLYMKNDATSGAVKILHVANSSADVFSVDQGGDVVIGRDALIGGNLHVAGTTTQINTTTTLTRDKTIIIGAQSNVVTGATYTAANPPVVTSTGHTLNNGQIIFITSSTGTAITSEILVKVSANGTNVFTPTTIADVAIAGSGDSTTRTLSYVGPQTDAIVDDAGIYAPGSTGIHTIKWDDTDNYWKLNDSTLIDSTGQFVFPKGTDAERPAGGSATLAAATTGAARYNSDNSKFEFVQVGTTYENISSEGFSTAMAIALG